MEQFFIGVGTTATVILAAIGFINYQKNKVKLKTDIELKKLTFPKILSECFEGIYRNRLGINIILENREITKTNEDEYKNAIKAISDISELVAKYDAFRDYCPVNSCCELAIKNEGNEIINDIEIRNPNGILFEIKENDDWKTLTNSPGEISLKPDESKKFRIWSRILYNDIEIYQSKGKAKIIKT